jgi:hydroxyethylthiazole kinase-like uncharacterized protein yjeF
VTEPMNPPGPHDAKPAMLFGAPEPIPDPPLSRDAVRNLDRRAIDEAGIPSLLLMENAGRGAAMIVAQVLAELPLRGDAEELVRRGVRFRSYERLTGRGVCIFAGTGNNGGDGFVVARHLINMGADALVVLLGREADIAADSDPGVNLRLLKQLGAMVMEAPDADTVAKLRDFVMNADVIVDAIFGTGLSRAVGEPQATAIRAIESAHGNGKPVVALDIPSGIDADTGAILGEVAVTATVTPTFGALKRGLLTGDGADRSGDVVLIEIGLPIDQIIDAHRAADRGENAAR